MLGERRVIILGLMVNVRCAPAQSQPQSQCDFQDAF